VVLVMVCGAVAFVFLSLLFTGKNYAR
jgi:hypothetical protein